MHRYTNIWPFEHHMHMNAHSCEVGSDYINAMSSPSAYTGVTSQCRAHSRQHTSISGCACLIHSCCTCRVLWWWSGTPPCCLLPSRCLVPPHHLTPPHYLAPPPHTTMSPPHTTTLSHTMMQPHTMTPPPTAPQRHLPPPQRCLTPP